MEQRVDIAHYHNVLSRKHQIIRLLWGIAWPVATWFLPRSMGMPWKRMWGATASVYKMWNYGPLSAVIRQKK